MGERWIAQGGEIGAQIVGVRGPVGISGGQLELWLMMAGVKWLGVQRGVRFMLCT